MTEKISYLKSAARNVTSEEDCFDLFVSDDMFELITSNTTNKRIDEHLDKLWTFKEHTLDSSKYIWFKLTTKEELKTFVGLVYFRGFYGLNHYNIKLLLKSAIGLDIFGAAMSQQRMRFLLAHITFDCNSLRKDRPPSDRFATGRDIFEMFNKNCSKYVIPYLAIDKTLYPMRHQISFRQYNPKKPYKYGLFLRSINDLRFPFTYKAALYASQPENGDGPYYICATEDYVKNLVKEVEKDTGLKGRNISADGL